MSFKKFFINESKQEIVRLGYPDVVAKILHAEFGKNAFLIGRWFIEYRFGDQEIPGNWWLQATSSFHEIASLYDLTYLYGATDSVDEYLKALEKLELSKDDDEIYDDMYLKDQRDHLFRQIEGKFFEETFFRNTMIKDIKEERLKNVGPYKKMKFRDAQDAYDKKRVFEDRKPLKKYKNGYKWIDVGMRCQLVGNQMKHCGSTGLMSMDKDRTMLVLFGPENTSHVTVTYSPNEGRISGDVGVGSSAIKPKYHKYVLDLTKILNANFDTGRSKSKLLSLKYILRDKTDQIESLKGGTIYDEYFRFILQGKEYYTNGYSVATKEDLDRLKQAMSKGEITLRSDARSPVASLFNAHNKDMIQHVLGIKFIPLNSFAS